MEAHLYAYCYVPTFFIKFKSPCKITSELLCRCKNKTYPKFKEKISVVMNYHNEVLSLLLRSIYSVINSIPRDNFYEFILIDDDSNLTKYGKVK